MNSNSTRSLNIFTEVNNKGDIIIQKDYTVHIGSTEAEQGKKNVYSISHNSSFTINIKMANNYMLNQYLSIQLHL